MHNAIVLLHSKYWRLSSPKPEVWTSKFGLGLESLQARTLHWSYKVTKSWNHCLKVINCQKTSPNSYLDFEVVLTTFMHITQCLMLCVRPVLYSKVNWTLKGISAGPWSSDKVFATHCELHNVKYKNVAF